MRGIALCVLVVSCLVAAVAAIPAKVFIPEDHYFTTRRVAMIKRVSGTLWKGQFLLQSRDKQTQILVEWDSNPLCLLGARVCVNLHARTAAPFDVSSELFTDISVPITSLLFSSGCAPLSRLSLSNTNGILTSQAMRLFVPELEAAEQELHFRKLALDVDLSDGVVHDAQGQFDISAGLVSYTLPSGGSAHQQIEAISGQVENGDGFALILENQQGEPYIALNTDIEGSRLTFIVYDHFAIAFGASGLKASASGVPRFEISQRISDMLCEAS